MEWSGPVLDNHMHLDLDGGLGMEVVEDFVRAGGTHLLVVNKPCWWYGVEVTEGADFATGFEATRSTVERINDVLPGRAWPVMGVHPALISRLVDAGYSPDEAGGLMRAGIDRAARRVAAGEALALKSGRPHYDVAPEVWAASNEVIRHAFERAAEHDCAVQLHTESGAAFPEFREWAEDVGLPPRRVVKHYAEGSIEGATPSVISRREALEDAAEAGQSFLMETDFLDDPDRPGAVLGTKTVPRRVAWLAETGKTGAIERAHVETPEAVYGIDTRSTRSG